MSRSSVAATILALSLAAAAPCAEARTTKRVASACSKLHGYDRAPNPTVRLIWQRADTKTFTGSRLVSCILPRGKVRTVFTESPSGPGSEEDAESATATLDEVRGTHALMTVMPWNPFQAQTTEARVYDLRSGSRYVVSSACTGRRGCSGENSALLRPRC